MYHEIIMGGVGGQGIMVIGNLLAHAAFLENLNVSYIPIYGVEKRGGQADCTVVISSEEIGSPIVGSPQSCIVMSKASMAKYVPKIKGHGFLLLNSSLVSSSDVPRHDLEILEVPALEIAQKVGSERLGNMVVIGAFVEKTKVVGLDTLIAALSETFEERFHHLLPVNTAAIRQGAQYARNSTSQRPQG
ncbi:MAG: 2-oxoacid:acceptor oxidoreductase family protein [Deltaproteobacteria bacterium]|nr:2-oxoacid:acceptor oxidoreductase family protein [Deltaproteobacteria bacterium]